MFVKKKIKNIITYGLKKNQILKLRILYFKKINHFFDVEMNLL